MQVLYPVHEIQRRPMTKFSEIFKTMTCNRCGGCGHYSFNPRDGTICFGCGGKGTKYTPTSRKALAEFHRRMTVEAGNLQIDERVLVTGITLAGSPYKRWDRIANFERYDSKPGPFHGSEEWVKISYEKDGANHHCPSVTLIERSGTEEEREALFAELYRMFPRAYVDKRYAGIEGQHPC